MAINPHQKTTSHRNRGLLDLLTEPKKVSATATNGTPS